MVSASPREGDGATASKWTVKCKDCWPAGDGVLLCESHASYALLLARVERLEQFVKLVAFDPIGPATATECVTCHGEKRVSGFGGMNGEMDCPTCKGMGFKPPPAVKREGENK